MIDIKSQLAECAALTEGHLQTVLADGDGDYEVIFDSIRYSTFAGGKRIRPFLSLSVSRMLGGEDAAVLPFAAAVEMIHTYSLIHDDLPCMDNDDLRRGRDTNHKVYGEAIALLAGDALLTAAFAAAAGNTKVDPQTALRAVKLLSARAGSLGMIGGQVLDMIGEEKPHTFALLLKMHAKKTGALIAAAAELGALAAGCTEEGKIAKIREYASKIGLAFQIVDDILDKTGDEKILGKPIGSDAEESKTTFLTFMTVEAANDYAAQITGEAKAALDGFENNDTLLAFADYLLERKY